MLKGNRKLMFCSPIECQCCPQKETIQLICCCFSIPPEKHLKTFRFSDVSREYRKAAANELTDLYNEGNTDT